MGRTWYLLAGLVVLAAIVAAPMNPAMAASIVVNTTADELNTNGDCSLREAITAANTDTAVDACPAGAGADTITVPAGTYTLSILGTGENASATGDLDVTGDLTINGAGAGSTVIDGGAIDRVLDILAGVTAQISGVTVQNGNGGIYNNGTLTLTDVTVSGNTADAGGGIYNGGTATLTNSTVSDGTALAFGGGGIYNSGTATLTNSTVSGNTAKSGGGIYNGGTATLTNSTVSGNTTVTGGAGGGISNTGTLTLTDVTVSGNTAPSGSGGGIYNTGGTATLTNSIVANSVSGGDCVGTITSSGYNLDSDGTCALTGTGDLPNTNPMLGLLADTGGPTLTHALLPGSPAIDAGDDGACPETDQRGVTRPQGGACDIGAFELTKQGDVDCNGSADSVDALKLLRHVAGLSVSQQPGCPAVGTGDPLFGDVDCSGAVDSVDALKVLRHVAGLSVAQTGPCLNIGTTAGGD